MSSNGGGGERFLAAYRVHYEGRHGRLPTSAQELQAEQIVLRLLKEDAEEQIVLRVVRRLASDEGAR